MKGRHKKDEIVVIGGGTGLSTMLRGLKKYTEDITAIVAVSDDGGGSGVLRADLGILPPGDIRNCIVALSNTEPVMERLLNYRFQDGSLAGQSFGNLFLAALDGVCGSFYQAVRYMSDVLAISGRVLPVTVCDVNLEAEFENGVVTRGESKIMGVKKAQDSRIKCVRLVPENPPALEETLEAIINAKLLVLGPGSLYTSIIPNLLVDGVVDAIRASEARRVYVCNVMTQDGETEGYTAFDHAQALFDHSAPDLFDMCIVNSEPISEKLAKRYAAEGAECTYVDSKAFENAGVK
ncbi:MAG: YvcK family protein, partial [Clostridia bacterium]